MRCTTARRCSRVARLRHTARAGLFPPGRPHATFVRFGKSIRYRDRLYGQTRSTRACEAVICANGLGSRPTCDRSSFAAPVRPGRAAGAGRPGGGGDHRTRMGCDTWARRSKAARTSACRSWNRAGTKHLSQLGQGRRQLPFQPADRARGDAAAASTKASRWATTDCSAKAPARTCSWCAKGKLLTPPTSAGILAGITRDSVTRAGTRSGHRRCRRARPAARGLYFADEVFMTGTAAEITPVRSVDRKPVGNGHAAARSRARCRRLSSACSMAARRIRGGWLTPMCRRPADRDLRENRGHLRHCRWRLA